LKTGTGAGAGSTLPPKNRKVVRLDVRLDVRFEAVVLDPIEYARNVDIAPQANACDLFGIISETNGALEGCARTGMPAL
jgi:hypothetical protein